MSFYLSPFEKGGFVFFFFSFVSVTKVGFEGIKSPLTLFQRGEIKGIKSPLTPLFQRGEITCLIIPL